MASENNKRIAKNTMFLYVRMLLIMGVTLYTSRGMVALLGFISSSMSISIQRFLSYEIGRQNYPEVSRIFSMALQIHVLIAIFMILFWETVGGYFLQHKMVIPIDRMDAAITVFHFSVISCGFSVIQVPFIALIIAYERMNLYAYISVVEAILRLGTALILNEINFDSLQLYGGLMLASTASIMLTYVFITFFRFKEIRYTCIWDKDLFQSLTQFASWSAFGEMAWGFTLQGVNIVLNLFFGTIVNAAYGISSQVSSAVYRFISSFQTAVNPQLIKTYAQGNITDMLNLAFRGIKFSFFLLMFISIPLVTEMDFILSIWLGEVPDHASTFCRMVVVNALLDVLSSLFATLAKAYGKIRNYQLLVSAILFLNFPLSYIALWMGYTPSVVFIVYSLVSISLIPIRCFLISRMFQTSIFPEYFNRVIIPIFKVVLAILLVPLLLRLNMETSWLRLWVISLSSSAALFLIIYSLGLTYKERTFVDEKVINLTNRLIKRHNG